MNDALIIGAGFSGMTAALELAKAGRQVVLIEAKLRAGGRVFTEHDPAVNAAIELGAEFIHGLPQEIWDLLRAHEIPAHEVQGDTWCLQKGKLTECDFFEDVNEIFGRMPANHADQSFADFLTHTSGSEEAKKWAEGYVTGFHAADPSLISLQSLVRGTKADEEIEGERAFRIPQLGYEALRQLLIQQLAAAGVQIRLATVAKEIVWREDAVEVRAETAGDVVSFEGRRCLVTIPLGVLQSDAGALGHIQFQPNLPPSKHQAMEQLAMGKVIRVTLRFREPFWRSVHPAGESSLKDLSFLLSQQPWFPTWWTTLPEDLPLITGWATFQNAERLSGRDTSFVVKKAISALSSITGVRENEIESGLESAYSHDWQHDPFARGAYSYVKVGGEGAQRALSEPIGHTLYFAGEATDVTGHHGTVHGAMASGYRAAAEMLAG